MSRKIITLIMLLLLTACTASSKPEPTTGQNEDTMTPTTESVPPTPEPQTESIPNTQATRAGFITFHQTGGFLGLDNKWTLQADGTLTDKDGNLISTTDEATLNTLWAYVNNGEFFTYEDSYVPENTCCDFFFYDITINDGTREKMVATMDSAPQPPTLKQFIQDANAQIGIISQSQ